MFPIDKIEVQERSWLFRVEYLNLPENLQELVEENLTFHTYDIQIEEDISEGVTSLKLLFHLSYKIPVEEVIRELADDQANIDIKVSFLQPDVQPYKTYTFFSCNITKIKLHYSWNQNTPTVMEVDLECYNDTEVEFLHVEDN